MSHLKKTKNKKKTKNHELLEDQAFTIYNYSSKKKQNHLQPQKLKRFLLLGSQK